MPRVLQAALSLNASYSVEKGCLQAVAVVEREDKRQLVEQERIKQGFLCPSNESPDPFLSDCPLLCLMVSGSLIGA